MKINLRGGGDIASNKGRIMCALITDRNFWRDADSIAADRAECFGLKFDICRHEYRGTTEQWTAYDNYSEFVDSIKSKPVPDVSFDDAFGTAEWRKLTQEQAQKPILSGIGLPPERPEPSNKIFRLVPVHPPKDGAHP